MRLNRRWKGSVSFFCFDSLIMKFQESRPVFKSVSDALLWSFSSYVKWLWLGIILLRRNLTVAPFLSLSSHDTRKQNCMKIENFILSFPLQELQNPYFWTYVISVKIVPKVWSEVSRKSINWPTRSNNFEVEQQFLVTSFCYLSIIHSETNILKRQKDATVK